MNVVLKQDGKLKYCGFLSPDFCILGEKLSLIKRPKEISDQVYDVDSSCCDVMFVTKDFNIDMVVFNRSEPPKKCIIVDDKQDLKDYFEGILYR